MSTCELIGLLNLAVTPQPLWGLTEKMYLVWQSGPPLVFHFPPQSRSQGRGPVSFPPGEGQGGPHPGGPPQGSCSATLDWKMQKSEKFPKKRGEKTANYTIWFGFDSDSFLALTPDPEGHKMSQQSLTSRTNVISMGTTVPACPTHPWKNLMLQLKSNQYVSLRVITLKLGGQKIKDLIWFAISQSLGGQSLDISITSLKSHL